MSPSGPSIAKPSGDHTPLVFGSHKTLEGLSASSLAKIRLAGSGSCDAGRAAFLLNFRGRVFANRERLYRISALVDARPILLSILYLAAT